MKHLFELDAMFSTVGLSRCVREMVPIQRTASKGGDIKSHLDGFGMAEGVEFYLIYAC